ncbi:Metal transporter [Nymphaea thermarum]|nr:Metal transporter [Nymphaea thermarum]
MSPNSSSPSSTSPLHLPLLCPSKGKESIEDEELEDHAAFSESQRISVKVDDDVEKAGAATDGGRNDEDRVPPFSWRKLWLFAGPGFLMSIAFLDPGNLEGDLQAGAVAGYSLMWLLTWATAVGLIIQLLSARLGVATGSHLAEMVRREYPRWASYILWAMAEIALIGADIQEVIGSAIAIRILSNGLLPLWFGVLITAADCFVLLLMENYGVRKLEAFFGVLITIMAISFAWMFGEARPSGKDLLLGVLIPRLTSSTIKQAVGIVGCIIMPHNVFLHSALVQSRNIDKTRKADVREALSYYSIESSVALFVTLLINLFVTAVFAKGFYGSKDANNIGLMNAAEYLDREYGYLFPVRYIWAIGLLAAGQSSTMTGTYAGQFVMSGFLDLHMKKWIRAAVTRSFAIVPTIIVTLVFDSSENQLDVLNEWLNVLQSVQIPFALVPLLCLVSKKHLMGVLRIGNFLKVSSRIFYQFPSLSIVSNFFCNLFSWAMTLFIMAINGYLLVDFFRTEALTIGTMSFLSVSAKHVSSV